MFGKIRCFSVVVVIGLMIAVFPVSSAFAQDHFLWEVQKEDQIFSLLGSFHLMPEGVYPLSSTIEGAFGNAGYIVVEVDIVNQSPLAHQQLIRDLGMYAEGESLKDDLPQDLYQEVMAWGQEIGLPETFLQEQKPWLVSQTVVAGTLQELGYSFAQGVDQYFLERAHKKQKGIIELESLEMQLEVSAGFDLDIQKALLREALHTDAEEVQESLETALNAWKQGDKEGVEEFFFSSLEEEPVLKDYYQAMYEDRNDQMADAIEDIVDGKDTMVMVIVGSGHIVGDHGLLEIFEDRGYTVRQQ